MRYHPILEIDRIEYQVGGKIAHRRIVLVVYLLDAARTTTRVEEGFIFCYIGATDSLVTEVVLTVKAETSQPHFCIARKWRKEDASSLVRLKCLCIP